MIDSDIEASSVGSVWYGSGPSGEACGTVSGARADSVCECAYAPCDLAGKKFPSSRLDSDGLTSPGSLSWVS